MLIGSDTQCIRFTPELRSVIELGPFGVNANAIAGVARDFRSRISVRLKARPGKLAVSETHEHLFMQM